MKVSVLYFAQVAEKLGVTKEEIELEAGSNSEKLVSILKNKYPVLGELVFQIAVDQELTKTPRLLSENSEVALLPPFAGG